MNIVWSSEARRSLRAIERFIAQDSEFYAARMTARIIDRVERAAKSTTQGHAVHEYPEKPLKEVHESPYRIIYGFRKPRCMWLQSCISNNASQEPDWNNADLRS